MEKSRRGFQAPNTPFVKHSDGSIRLKVGCGSSGDGVQHKVGTVIKSEGYLQIVKLDIKSIAGMLKAKHNRIIVIP